MEDSEIIGLYHNRSEDALSQTAQKYGGYCRSIAWNILGNVLDVEETLNDTWLAAWIPYRPRSPGG
jgi:RNA polymerase sigma-70 factor (ECF subfamily)